MSARNKLLIPILVLTVLTVAGSIAVYQAFGGMGTLVVDVHPKRAGGDQVYIEMPGAVIPMTMFCIPDHAFIDCDVDDEDMRYVGPIMRAVFNEIGKMPDTEIVHVETSDETVSIVKEGRNLIIDVETYDESVHLTIPIKAVQSVSKKMEKIIRNNST